MSCLSKKTSTFEFGFDNRAYFFFFIKFINQVVDDGLLANGPLAAVQWSGCNCVHEIDVGAQRGAGFSELISELIMISELIGVEVY